MVYEKMVDGLKPNFNSDNVREASQTLHFFE